jgi:hypothetical protein
VIRLAAIHRLALLGLSILAHAGLLTNVLFAVGCRDTLGVE